MVGLVIQWRDPPLSRSRWGKSSLFWSNTTKKRLVVKTFRTLSCNLPEWVRENRLCCSPNGEYLLGGTAYGQVRAAHHGCCTARRSPVAYATVSMFIYHNYHGSITVVGPGGATARGALSWYRPSVVSPREGGYGVVILYLFSVQFTGAVRMKADEGLRPARRCVPVK